MFILTGRISNITLIIKIMDSRSSWQTKQNFLSSGLRETDQNNYLSTSEGADSVVEPSVSASGDLLLPCGGFGKIALYFARRCK